MRDRSNDPTFPDHDPHAFAEGWVTEDYLTMLMETDSTVDPSFHDGITPRPWPRHPGPAPRGETRPSLPRVTPPRILRVQVRGG